MRWHLQVIIVASIFMADIAKCANILAMFPLPLYSHTINYMPIFKELAARGHNVTMVSPFPQKTPIPNLNDVKVELSLETLITDSGKPLNFVEMDGIIFDLVGLWLFGLKIPKLVLEYEEVTRFIKDTDSKYDLIITETWFVQEIFVAFGHKYNAPVINIANSLVTPFPAYYTGNDMPASYVPVPKLQYSDHMSFVQRLWNFLYYHWDVSIGSKIYMWYLDALMREYFVYPGSESLPPLEDMLKNTSLTLMDSNIAIHYPIPLHKNIIEIGGINMKKAEKLPEDLQKFMDSAKDGVIYFSFGSHIKLSSIPENIMKAIVSAFGKLKQKVLMKVESGNPIAELAGPNILVRNWFPQASILAHPNCKIFVTHGGVHSLMEVVYNAVPMVAIPLIADQKFHAKLIETTGIGKVLKFTDITEEYMLLGINEVLNNPMYKENVKERSTIFKDTPISTLNNAIFWIEYVIRHKGAPHLRPAAVDLYWYQYFLLDVIAFYLIVSILIVFVLKVILTSVCGFIKNLIWGKAKSKTSSKKKKQ